MQSHLPHPVKLDRLNQVLYEMFEDNEEFLAVEYVFLAHLPCVERESGFRIAITGYAVLMDITGSKVNLTF